MLAIYLFSLGALMCASYSLVMSLLKANLIKRLILFEIAIIVIGLVLGLGSGYRYLFGELLQQLSFVLLLGSLVLTFVLAVYMFTGQGIKILNNKRTLCSPLPPACLF